jgi:hypothetical protein
MWEIVNALVGWDHLTPQGIRLGIASFLALRVIAPGWNSFFEVAVGIIFSIDASLLVAQAKLPGNRSDRAPARRHQINRLPLVSHP